jgi:D-Tyr-tRNAtyr deacylase
MLKSASARTLLADTVVEVGVDRRTAQDLSLSIDKKSKGLMVDDNESDIAPIIKKVLGGKLFEDEQGGLWKQNIIPCSSLRLMEFWSRTPHAH